MRGHVPVKRRVLLFVGTLAVVAGLLVGSPGPVTATTADAAPAASEAPAAVAPELEARADAGEVRVIAVTDAPGAQVVDDVVAAAPDDSISDVSGGPSNRVVATVDGPGLDALRAVPGVTEVVEDKLNRITDDSWPGVIGVALPRTLGYEGTGRTVAVLDAGVQVDHPFLAGRVLDEACFSTHAPGSGIESLCPGQATEAHGEGTGTPCTGIPGCGHGTHVAGLAAGVQLSGASTLTGTAPGASLLAVKVFSKGTNTGLCGAAPPCLVAFDSDIVDALTWLQGLRQADDPRTATLDAVNLSLGGGLYKSQCDDVNPTISAAFAGLRSLGVAPVVAAGNNGSRTSISSPACISSAVSVAATNGAGAVASFSNLNGNVTLLAPGTAMTSSLPGSSYGSMSGTSMASPVVAGSIAVMRQASPDGSITTIVDDLRRTGTTVTNGAVVLPEVQLDSAIAGVPGDVRSLAASPAFGAATVSWQPPGYLGADLAVSSYTVTASPGGATCTTTGLSCRVSGLTNGVSHTFRVVATDRFGANGAGTTVAATPKALPGTVPFGSLDVAGPAPGAVVVAGWAIDPETTASIPVHVYVDGVLTGLTANGSRPDVDTAFGYGAQHGFSATIPAAGGTHTVCVYAINATATLGTNAVLGCRFVTVPTGPPIGSLDLAYAGPGKVTVGGWAIDPDTAAPIAVHVYVGSTGAALTAGEFRSDLASFFGPYGGNHAFNGVVAVAPGTHTVCAYGINVGGGATSTLGCRVVTVSTGAPIGSLEVMSASGPQLTVGGWALDWDTAAPIAVHVYVTAPGYLQAFALTANVARPEIGAIVPGYGPLHGFSAVTTLPSTVPRGATVCAYGINVGGGANSSLGCRVVP